MSKYFYDGLLNTRDSLVIYKCEKEDSQSWGAILKSGYIEAADYIVKEMKGGYSLGPQHDCLLHPLLNIYCCALEFSLKESIRRLSSHKNDDNCPFLNPPKKNSSKNLRSHDLTKLFRDFINMINQKSIHPHVFKSKALLSEIIGEFKDNHIHLMSTRYHQTKIDQGEDIFPLYNKQKNIRIYKLHQDIVSVLNSLDSFIGDEDFNLCATGCFNKDSLHDLKKVYDDCKKNEALFKPFICNSSNIIENKPEDMFLTGDALLKSLESHNSPEERKFSKRISKLTTIEQNNILICLYLGTRQLTLALSSLGPNKADNTSNILRLAHNYTKGLKNLNYYIQHIKSFI